MNEPKDPVKKGWRVVLATAAVFVLAVLFLETGRAQWPKMPALIPAAQPGTYKVTEVMDGDTIKVELAGYRDTVRLIGVDTPETKDPRKPVQCFGVKASEKTAEWVLGRQVRLEADPADSDRDKYGRLLRYVYLEDGRLLNAELIKEGYGFAYTLFPFGKLEEFRRHEAEARSAGRGLWAACGIDESRQAKQTSLE